MRRVVIGSLDSAGGRRPPPCCGHDAGMNPGAHSDSSERPYSVNKIFPNADAALNDLTDGASVMVGGFGLCGAPEALIEAVRRKGTNNLSVISNNCGAAGRGLVLLLEANQLARVVASYPGENKLLLKIVNYGGAYGFYFSTDKEAGDEEAKAWVARIRSIVPGVVRWPRGGSEVVGMSAVS